MRPSVSVCASIWSWNSASRLSQRVLFSLVISTAWVEDAWAPDLLHWSICVGKSTVHAPAHQNTTGMAIWTDPKNRFCIALWKTCDLMKIVLVEMNKMCSVVFLTVFSLIFVGTISGLDELETTPAIGVASTACYDKFNRPQVKLHFCATYRK